MIRVAVGYIASDDADLLSRYISPLGGVAVVHRSSDEDATRKVFAEHKYSIVDREWDGDYAAARNTVLRVAEELEYDVVFVLDCDEFIQSEDIVKAAELVCFRNKLLGLCPRINLVGEGKMNTELYPDWTGRVIRLGRGVRYVGKVHEWPTSKEGICLGPTHNDCLLLPQWPIEHWQVCREYQKTWLRQHNYRRILDGQEPLKEPPAGLTPPRCNPFVVGNV